jgi:hypothetical protein
MDEMRKLAEQVRAAFADVPYPGDGNIVPGGPGAWEPDAIAEVLRGKDWRDLSGIDFEYGSAPSFLTPEAFRYYLPALLLNLLDGLGPQGWDSPTYFDSLAMSTCTSLEPPPYSLPATASAVLGAERYAALDAMLGTEVYTALAAHFAGRVALLSPAQRAAVRDVLRYDARMNPATPDLEEDRARHRDRPDDVRLQWSLEVFQHLADKEVEMLAFWERAADEAG